MTDDRETRKNKKGKPKGKPGRPSVYAPEVRAKALKLVPEVGLAKAAMKLHIPKGTLWDWCNDAGVPTSTEESRARTEAATAAAKLAKQELLANSHLTLTANLAEIADLGTQVEIKRLKAALEKAGDNELDLTKLSEIVGARTRAIHDLQLLQGKATDRTEHVDSTDEILGLQVELEARLKVVE